jgi:hypothetical protein
MKKLELDDQQIKKLAEIQCTMAEIASVMGCSVDTLERRYRTTIETGKNCGHASLRRMQYKKAMEGNPSMLIWLGKIYLGQREDAPLSSCEPEVRKLFESLEKKHRSSIDKSSAA